MKQRSSLDNKKWAPKSGHIKHQPDLIFTLKLATIAYYCTMCLQIIASQQAKIGSQFQLHVGTEMPIAHSEGPFVQWSGPETSMSANLSSGSNLILEAGQIVEQPVAATVTVPNATTTTTTTTTNATSGTQTELGYYKADNANLPLEQQQRQPDLWRHNIEIEGHKNGHQAADTGGPFQQQEKLIKTTSSSSINSVAMGHLQVGQPEPLLMAATTTTVVTPSAKTASDTTTTTTTTTTSESESDATATAAAADVAAANDEDVVISSSEILTDNRQLASLQPMNQKPFQKKHNKQEDWKQQQQLNLEIGNSARNCSGQENLEATNLGNGIGNGFPVSLSSSDSGGTSDNGWTSFGGISLEAPAAGQPDDADLRHHLNSRLLLQILVIGLFGLVTLTLMVVYTIKFCVCRRRKRRLMLLRRNLVADSAVANLTSANCQPPGHHHQHQHHNHNLFHPALECTCPAVAPPGAAAAAAMLAPEPPARLESLFRPNYNHLTTTTTTSGGLWTIGGHCGSPTSLADNGSHLLSPSSLYQQLALAERLHTRTATTNTSSGAAAASTIGCTFCLGCTNNVHSFHSHQQQRPPTYSELFGSSSSPGGHGQGPEIDIDIGRPLSPSPNINTNTTIATNTTTTTAATNDGRNISQTMTEITGSPRTETGPLSTLSESSQNESGASSTNTSEPTIANHDWLQQNKKNLLVKLNLNKTKLLSAEDLMLLSQLIDVPIIVQQQQPPAAAAGAAGASSCSDDAATIDESEEQEQDQDGHNIQREQQLQQQPRNQQGRIHKVPQREGGHAKQLDNGDNEQ